MARCWAATPYDTHMGLRADGKAFFTANEQGQIAQNIRTVSLNAAQPDRSIFANTDYRIRIIGRALLPPSLKLAPLPMATRTDTTKPAIWKSIPARG